MPRATSAGRKGAAPAAVAIISVLAAGCGGSEAKRQDPQATDRAAIRNVLRQLQEASRAGHGERICTQIFTPNLENAVMRAARSGSCAEEVRRQLFSRNARLTVQDVTVNDPANATATVREANGNTATLFFIKQSGRWRIRTLQPA